MGGLSFWQSCLGPQFESMADEESIQLELLAQLEELNRISMAVSPHPVVSAPCVQAAGGSVCVPYTKRWGSFLRVEAGGGWGRGRSVLPDAMRCRTWQVSRHVQ